jgi:hypothetical protein
LDYDTLSRDTALLGREMDGWVKSLPVGDTVTHEGVKEGPVVAASGGLYEGKLSEQSVYEEELRISELMKRISWTKQPNLPLPS